MSDVLCRMKYFKGETVEKFSLREQTSDRFETPSCFRPQQLRYIFKLRDIFRAYSYLFLELLEIVKILFACLSFIGFGQSVVAISPDPFLVRVVIYPRYFFVSDFIAQCQVANELSARSVLRVLTARMINFIYSIAEDQYSFPVLINIFNFLGKPRHFNLLALGMI